MAAARRPAAGHGLSRLRWHEYNWAVSGTPSQHDTSKADRLPLFLIVNPESAGGLTGRRWPALERLLSQQRIPFEHRLTDGPGDAGVIARLARDRGFRRIVCVGGDGTFNEVVNGLSEGEGLASQGVAVGFIPSGTGLDLARNLGIPSSMARAAQRLAMAREVLVDLGVVETLHSRRVFVNSAGAGLDAEVALRANRWRKRLPGTIPYVLGLLAALPGYRQRVVRVQAEGVEAGSRMEMTAPVLMVAMANGRSFAGGMRIAPHAVMTDGLLDTVIIGEMTPLELLVNFPRVYVGKHLSHPKVTSFRARWVSLEADEATRIQTDGEQAGQLPATFRVLPGALRLLV